MFDKIVLASGNAGKLKDFPRLFADLNIEVLPQSQFNTPECPEPYHTFVENALAKALRRTLTHVTAKRLTRIWRESSIR